MMPAFFSCYEATPRIGVGDLTADEDPQTIPPEADLTESPMDLEFEQVGEDWGDVQGEAWDDSEDVPDDEAQWDEWCLNRVGCIDGCCEECENGSAREIGGCWYTCEEYFSIEMDCNVICPDYTCDVGSWEFISPGCTGLRDQGFCMRAFGKNSFWYRGALTVRVSEEYPEPDCPSDNPCCQIREYEVGFEVGADCGGLGFVPLDSSEVSEIYWLCEATNCGAECVPPAGTVVKVHVRWYPDHINPPEKFIIEELCEIL